jgi:prepilin peptidase CpaA
VAPVTSGVVYVVLSCALVVVAGIAAATDLRSRRIPNWLTLGGLTLALLVRMGLGWSALLDGMGGAGAGLALGFLLFALGGFGAGDAKLLMAIGAFMGWSRLPGAILAIGVAGGVLALAESARRGVLPLMLLRTAGLMRHWVTLGRSGIRQSVAEAGAVTIPYGVPIAVGAVAWWFFGGTIL